MARVAEPRLAACGVVREFGPGIGVSGIDLSVDAGQIHALVGLNGAGKTTLLRLLLGMLRSTAGSITIDGEDLRDATPATWARLGHLVDHPLAYGELDTRTNIAIGARLHGLPRSEVAAACDDILTELDLGDYAGVRSRKLSLGNRQRLGLAVALVHRPSLIVLDEPAIGLDPAGIILLRQLLLRRARDGAGVIVSSHHLDEVARVADQITAVNAGRVVGELDPTGHDLERAFFALVHADDQARSS